MDTVSYTVIIPTLNAGERIDTLLEAIEAQSIPPREILVVDSASEDGTPERVTKHPLVRLIRIPRSEFDHGGTRDMAIHACEGPFIIMMTQDALPIERTCMESLLKPFEDEQVAAVCGRQVAYSGSKPAEKQIRAFRYPEESRVWGRQDLPALGIRGFLISDVCVAYRRSAYEKVGGFRHPLMTNEDMLIAADFLDAGYRLAYSGDARVWHSHDYTFREEYERNRKIGFFMAEYGERFSIGSSSGETGEGLKLVRDVSSHLVKTGHVFDLFPFWFNCAARILGNRAGKREYRSMKKGTG